MSARSILLAAVLLGGCASAPETIAPDRLPTPTGDVFLPVYPSDIPHSVRITVRALIGDDGGVQAAEISPRSGSEQWDSLAVHAIRRWRFTPATQGGRAVPAWIRFPVTLRFAEARPIELAEIVVKTRSLADSLYSLLLEGHDFGLLASSHSQGPTASDSGRLGSRPLKSFPLSVQMVITSVGEGQVTRPLIIDGRYVIYKRSKKDASE